MRGRAVLVTRPRTPGGGGSARAQFAVAHTLPLALGARDVSIPLGVDGTPRLSGAAPALTKRSSTGCGLYMQLTYLMDRAGSRSSQPRLRSDLHGSKLSARSKGSSTAVGGSVLARAVSLQCAFGLKIWPSPGNTGGEVEGEDPRTSECRCENACQRNAVVRDRALRHGRPNHYVGAVRQLDTGTCVGGVVLGLWAARGS